MITGSEGVQLGETDEVEGRLSEGPRPILSVGYSASPLASRRAYTTTTVARARFSPISAA